MLPLSKRLLVAVGIGKPGGIDCSCCHLNFLIGGSAKCNAGRRLVQPKRQSRQDQEQDSAESQYQPWHTLPHED